MKHLVRSLCAAAAAIAVVALPITVFAPAADAQVAIPTVPIPALPPQLDPLLSVVAPLAQPPCASVAIVSVLGPVLFGPTIPLPIDVNLFGLFAPLYQVCGELAVPLDQTKYTCAVDDQVAALVTLATGTALGTGLPLDTRLIGPLVESIGVAENQAPADPGAGTPGLQATAVQAFACRAMGVASPPLPDDNAAPADDGGIVDLPTSSSLGDGFDPSQVLDAIQTAPIETPDLAVAGTNRPTTRIIDGRFKYPVIFLMPILLLVLGGYVGRVITRPIR